MKVRIIGDVHGKYKQYKKIIKDCERSVQVGDMGVGFRSTQGPNFGKIYSNPPFDAMNPNHEYIRGNHDNPEECKKQKLCILDGTVREYDRFKVMFVGGAMSHDREWRQEGYNWWADEELSAEEFDAIFEIYRNTKPDVMITHDCPQLIASTLMFNLNLEESRTRNAFEHMWVYHEPKYWFFGHFHKDWGQACRGTYFRCLGELSYYDIDL